MVDVISFTLFLTAARIPAFDNCLAASSTSAITPMQLARQACFVPSRTVKNRSIHSHTCAHTTTKAGRVEISPINTTRQNSTELQSTDRARTGSVPTAAYPFPVCCRLLELPRVLRSFSIFIIAHCALFHHGKLPTNQRVDDQLLGASVYRQIKLPDTPNNFTIFLIVDLRIRWIQKYHGNEPWPPHK